MSNFQENYINPFDNEKFAFNVLKNQQGEYSLWPESYAIPAGWNIQFGPETRAQCIQYVETHWHSINPFQSA